MSLSELKIGIIGTGNMGGAIARGLVSDIDSNNLIIFDLDESKAEVLAENIKIKVSSSINDLIDFSDIIILAVKPNSIASLLNSSKNLIKNKIIVSIAAGIKIKFIKNIVDVSNKKIRVMPNTPATIGEGISVMSPDADISDEIIEEVKNILSSTGQVEILPEKMMDAVTGLSGSGPAYVFTFIQALADGGVKMGIPFDSALKLAAQTVAGSAKMILEDMNSPISLRGKVASPGGTTISGIHELEKAGFSGIVMSAVESAAKKSALLGEE